MIRFGPALVIVSALTGCRPAVPADDAPIFTYEGLRPDAAPASSARLVLAGTPIPARIRVRRASPDFTLEIWANGAVVQREQYESTRAAFRLVRAAGERYSPPLDLLRFPLRLGDRWSWSGTVDYGAERKARAVVTTSSDRLYLPDAPRETVRVAVERTLVGPEPAAQKLTFWFEPGGGLIRREFGPADLREPARGAP